LAFELEETLKFQDELEAKEEKKRHGKSSDVPALF